MKQKKLILHVRTMRGSLSNASTCSLLMDEFAVRNVLHVQVSLATVNHISVNHEVLKAFKNLTKFITLKACF